MTIFSITILVAICVKGFAADGFVSVINGGYVTYHEDTFIKKTDICESLIRWGYLFSECLVLSLLISKNKSVKWIVSNICLPISILGFFYFPQSISYFLNPYYIDSEALCLINGVFATILTIIEYIGLFFCSLSIHLSTDHYLEKSDLKQTIKIGTFSLFTCIPFLVFPSLFGTTDIKIVPFNYAHICWIVFVPILFAAILLLFKNENQETKNTIIAVLVFYVVIHFISCYKIGYISSRAPFQLCNFAVFLFLIVLFTKWQRLFNFISVANPAGCIVAIICTDSGPIFGFWQLHYLIEHTYVFIIPLLMVYLGYIKKPRIKDLIRDFFIFFSAYFTFCLLLNGVHNGVVYNEENKVLNLTNFFFLVKCPIKDSVPFYPSLENLPVNIFGQKYYACYLIFVYVVYSLISISIYLIPTGVIKLYKLTNKVKH